MRLKRSHESRPTAPEERSDENEGGSEERRVELGRREEPASGGRLHLRAGVI